MALKNRDNLRDALKRLESETIEQESVPLAPVAFEFQALAERDKKEFKSSRLLENQECKLTRVLSELDSSERDISSSRHAQSGNQLPLDSVGRHISNSQPPQNYPIWPAAVVTFALGLTAIWLIFIGYGLLRLIVGTI